MSRQPETRLAFGVLVNYCLRHQVLLSVLLRFLTVCQGIRDRGSTARYGLTRTVVRLLPAFHVLLGPLTSSYSPRARNRFNQVVEVLRFDQVRLRLSISAKVFYGETWTMCRAEPVCATV